MIMKTTKSNGVKTASVIRCNKVIAHGRTGVLSRAVKVKFGSVTVVVHSQSAAEVERNVKAGQRALHRAKNKLSTHGVEISVSRKIPLFSVDPANPAILIRKVNGKEERGRLRNDRFEVLS